jgi:hypothetical protein
MSRSRLPTQGDRQAGPAQATRGPACACVRGARCRCRECGDYLSTAHVVRAVRGAFCGYCCPVCRRKPPLYGGGNAA